MPETTPEDRPARAVSYALGAGGIARKRYHPGQGEHDTADVNDYCEGKR